MRNRENILLIGHLREWLGTLDVEAETRLPPERELARRFGVSRTDLRKAMGILQREGVIERHVGRGTFLIDDPQLPRGDGDDIAQRTSPLAAMQARSVVEPELARLAALNATSGQIAEMRDLCSRMGQARSWDVYAGLDWRFHNVIAEATGNILLIEIQRLLNDVRRSVVWGNLAKRTAGPPADYHSFDEHRDIVDAIAIRDPARAMQAMLAHLGSTKSQLIDYREHAATLPAN